MDVNQLLQADAASSFHVVEENVPNDKGNDNVDRTTIVSNVSRVFSLLRKRDGIILVIFSSFVFSIMGAFTDVVATTLDPFLLTAMKIPPLMVWFIVLDDC